MRKPSRATPLSVVLLGIRDVEAAVSLSRTHIKRLVAAGRFPKPVQISEGRVAWPSNDIEQWIAERIAASKAA